ncbi:MAG TPA: Gx transporter family protein [Candidatus Scatomorpha gallistercoris]|nr:Gx transporter family protein [Candidatus Scatomorpha gallistercoris]
MRSSKRLALCAVLAAVALTIFVAESQIPPVVPMPGVKLGLANIVTLVAMVLLGRRDALAVLVVRLILGAAFTGGFSAFMFSAVGGLFAYIVMAALVGVFPEKMLWVVSVLAALAHNAGQILVAVFVTGTPGIAVYILILAASGVVTGAFTGLAGMFLIRAVRKSGLLK